MLRGDSIGRGLQWGRSQLVRFQAIDHSMAMPGMRVKSRHSPVGIIVVAHARPSIISGFIPGLRSRANRSISHEIDRIKISTPKLEQLERKTPQRSR